MDAKKIFITIAVFMIAIIGINCFKKEPEDYYCVTCIDRAMVKKDQTYCGKLNACNDFVEYVIISTVSIDSVSWECTIQ